MRIFGRYGALLARAGRRHTRQHENTFVVDSGADFGAMKLAAPARPFRDEIGPARARFVKVRRQGDKIAACVHRVASLRQVVRRIAVVCTAIRTVRSGFDAYGIGQRVSRSAAKNECK